MKNKVFAVAILFFLLTKVSAQIEVHSSNQVGIGTTEPQYKLHVVGDAFVTGNVIGNFQLRSDSNYLGTTANYPITFKVSNILSGSTGSSNNTNVSFGYESLLNPGLTNTNSTAIGYRALHNSANGNGHNTAIGAYTLHSNTTGSYNTAMGSEALRANSEGSNNIANGYQALYNNTTGNYNMAVGNEALRTNLTGSDNIAHGYQALYSNTSGNNNIAMGRNVLYNNTTGSHNTAMGIEALRANSEGSNNIANGHQALYNNTTGSDNIAIGSSVLYNNTTGSYNTAMGVAAGVGFRETDVINNSTAIGYQAPITASNQVRIGNSAVTSIGGYVSWSNLSDGRATKNTQSNVPRLAFINNLQPITYNMDLDAIDEITSGGKRLLSQMQIGETLGGKRIIFDTSKNLGKNRYLQASYIINGENGWKIQFSYFADNRTSKHYISIQLVAPSNNVVETIYSSSAWAIGAGNERFTWEWHKSEILVPLEFGIITSMVENHISGPGFFSIPTRWNLNDAWIAPPSSQPLDATQQQARMDKEAQVQSGFVAQDVETAAQDAGYNFSGVDVDEAGIYSLRYAEFVVPLVKAVQELSEQNNQLQQQINELKSRIETLENK